ncbi:hypothetical protein SAMN04488583_2892 [Mycobacterium sp. 88mf]|nr:hypothetical protein SAMN04488583_2892 [Mycobacterium sp. 88mf]SFF69048.1 hypothetical protein SAMN04488582_103809 [Mycobacterium sp. 455mf]
MRSRILLASNRVGLLDGHGANPYPERANR